MVNRNICELVQVAPYGAHIRRWTLRDENNSHHHGVVDLSESPFYLELSWRETSTSPVHRVGLFRLDLPGLLREGYIRTEPVDSYGPEIRLRIVREADGRFFIQTKRSSPRLLMT